MSSVSMKSRRHESSQPSEALVDDADHFECAPRSSSNAPRWFSKRFTSCCSSLVEQVTSRCCCFYQILSNFDAASHASSRSTREKAYRHFAAFACLTITILLALCFLLLTALLFVVFFGISEMPVGGADVNNVRGASGPPVGFLGAVKSALGIGAKYKPMKAVYDFKDPELEIPSEREAVALGGVSRVPVDEPDAAHKVSEQLVELQAWISVIYEQAPDEMDALARYLINALPSRFAQHGVAPPQDGKELEFVVNSVLRMRLRFPGFSRLTGDDPELEVRRPFDDIQMLKYRHTLQRDAKATRSDADQKWLSELGLSTIYQQSSIFNRRFYYPARRWQQIRPYAVSAPSVTDAWYTAMALEARSYAGADVDGRADPAGHPASQLEQSSLPSMLSLPFHSAENLVMRRRLAARERSSPIANRQVDEETIFVSFASFRDVECAPTLVDLMRKAKNIHRVSVGIAQQNHPHDPPCLSPELLTPLPCFAPLSPDLRGAGASEATAAQRVFQNYRAPEEDAEAAFSRSVCFFQDNIRIRQLTASRALGPTYGRYMAMLLYRGESLVMVLDSHNRFIPHWDNVGVRLWRKYEDPKALLSHYPEAYNDGPNFNYDRSTSAYLCQADFLKDFGYIRLKGIVVHDVDAYWKNNAYNDPYVAIKSSQIDRATNFRMPQPWVAGGFLFGNASIFREVPFDPHLPYIFDGEEVLYSMRLWTHGYNLFSPERSLAFHFYGRPKAPKVWVEAPQWGVEQAKSRRRVQYFLRSRFRNTDALRVPREASDPRVVVDADRFGMGRVRSVAQWYSYAGVNPVNYTLEGRWCG